MHLIDSLRRFAERLLLVESQGLCRSLFESCDGSSRSYLLRLKVEQRLDVVGLEYPFCLQITLYRMSTSYKSIKSIKGGQNQRFAIRL